MSPLFQAAVEASATGPLTGTLTLFSNDGSPVAVKVQPGRQPTI